MADDTVIQVNKRVPATRSIVVKAKDASDAMFEVASNAKLQDEITDRFNSVGAIEPPYSPAVLGALYEVSSSLRPNVEAYAVNIEGFGHRIVPRVDLSHPEIDDRLRDIIYLERIQDGVNEPPEPDEIVAAKEMLKRSMRMEQLRIEAFFENACADMSFVYLRKITRVDLEVTGNAYWEVLRDSNGAIAQFVSIPSFTMRLMRADSELTEFTTYRRTSALSIRPIRMRKRFRRFVQVINGVDTVFFKELEDPRVISSRSGRVYASLDDLQASEPGAPAATEILHFRIYAPQSPYGVPRWVGATLAVLGTRTSEEVNHGYFDNKAVPPLALLVSGTHLGQETVDRIEKHVRDHVQGKKNFHSILVIEAEAPENSLNSNANANVKLDFKSLSDVQEKDAMFQTYEKNNEEKVGAQFRLPRIIRGNMSDFNRSTGESALSYSEAQVFQPERADMDYIIDKRIMALLNAKYHEFISNAPDLRDPVLLAEAIAKLCDVGVLTPAEARSFIGDVFNVEISRSDEAWTRIPMKLLLGGIAPPKVDGDGDEGGADKPNIQLAPTDAAIVITVDEARAALGLPKLESGEGKKTLAEFRAGHEGLAPVKELASMQDALEKVAKIAQAKTLAEARKRMALVRDEEERGGVA